MLISETTDIEKIKRVLCDPEIYGRITDDGSPSIDEFEPVEPCQEVYYLTDENNIGLVFLHWMNSVTLVGHVQILKDGRAKAMEFGKEALNWIWENTPAQKKNPSLRPIPVAVQFIESYAPGLMNQATTKP